MDIDVEFAQSWDDYFDRVIEHFEKLSPCVPRQPVRPQAIESFQDRVEAAAVNAWSNGGPMSLFVAGDVAYATLQDIYFSLRRQLFQHGKRATFTKEECGVLLSALCSETVVARDRRQPAQLLNAQLKEALGRIPIFPISTLQEAAKKCATAVGSPALHDV
jgi:hypothetical protein